MSKFMSYYVTQCDCGKDNFSEMEIKSLNTKAFKAIPDRNCCDKCKKETIQVLISYEEKAEL